MFLNKTSEEDSKDEVFEERPRPAQYKGGIDTFGRMKLNCTHEEIMGFIKGNIDKYNFRKKGSDLQDYVKIADYANFAIEVITEKEKLEIDI